MSKYFGKIGYGVTEEIRPGVNLPDLTEREYYGDIVRNIRKINPDVGFEMFSGEFLGNG